MFASSTRYVGDYDRVTATLDKVIQRNESRQDRLLSQLEDLGQRQITTIRDQTDVLARERRYELRTDVEMVMLTYRLLLLDPGGSAENIL